ncbi:MAG: hypothetical protein WC686_01125 [Candidatus Shapirobacteria bacterium]|jgi:hypothetical protein
MKEKKGTGEDGVKIVNFEEINEEKIMYQWEALERPFQIRDRDYWITILTILILCGLILIIIKEFYFLLALVSAVFMYYVMSSTQPGVVQNKISNRGVYFGDKRYDWNTLERFWFGSEMGKEMVYFETIFKFPRQIALVVSPEDIEAVKRIAIKRIPLIASSPTFQDKFTKWLADKLPMENRVTDRAEKPLPPPNRS